MRPHISPRWAARTVPSTSMSLLSYSPVSNWREVSTWESGSWPRANTCVFSLTKRLAKRPACTRPVTSTESPTCTGASSDRSTEMAPVLSSRKKEFFQPEKAVTVPCNLVSPTAGLIALRASAMAWELISAGSAGLDFTTSRNSSRGNQARNEEMKGLDIVRVRCALWKLGIERA